MLKNRIAMEYTFNWGESFRMPECRRDFLLYGTLLYSYRMSPESIACTGKRTDRSTYKKEASRPRFVDSISPFPLSLLLTDRTPV